MSSDGVLNSSGAMWSGAGALYLAFVPVTSYITAENGIVQKAVETLVSFIPGNVPKDRVIPALSAFYIFAAFGATGAASVAGQAMARKGGLDNDHPRKHVNNMTGLPLRLRSAHYNLMENFPSFALAAALAQCTAPANQQIINLLGLHVILKTLVYYPCYLLGVAPVRSFAHLFSIASAINVAYRVALGAR